MYSVSRTCLLVTMVTCHVFCTQEELASLRRKLERVKKIELASSADEVLMEEIKEYKVQIYVFSYDIQFRVFLQNVSHISIGSGGNQNLRPSCSRPPARTFHTPVGTLRLDAPVLV